ncbi:MAG: hypothetical protein AUG51_16095 [Acidobacteria bacterium 13_1_20CM_3_53_8]|nr:MAG: hypothetical protein AUG51_16095 [Acidobacteria bacterium 13_1_20CM_3_53_8]
MQAIHRFQVAIRPVQGYEWKVYANCVQGRTIERRHSKNVGECGKQEPVEKWCLCPTITPSFRMAPIKYATANEGLDSVEA